MRLPFTIPSMPDRATSAALAPTKLFGVDLDYCQAHGTFFDRGEVAKLQEAGVDGKGKALSAGAIALGVLEILSFFG